jgi:hypothetical protein
MPEERRRQTQDRDYPEHRWTPEERRIMEERRRAARQRRRRNRQTAAIVVTVSIAAVVSLCIWYFGFMLPNDNYDAKMRIGVERFKAKEYVDAEKSFLSALTHKPNDPEAMLALSDTYAAEQKYDDAINEMKALQGIDGEDARTYERLIGLYVTGTGEIEKANEQIIVAYGRGYALESELIAPAPVFDPEGGNFEESTKIAIKAGEGLVIYYTTDDSIPTRDNGKQYKKKLNLKNNKSTRYIAVAYAENDLMSWPGSAEYKLSVKYGVDAGAVSYIGKTAKSIMQDVGPLFFAGDMEGGYYYKDEEEEFFYVFSMDDFLIDTTDGAIEYASPDKMPLPGGSKCVAVSMLVKNYIVQMDGNLKVEDFMIGVGVKEYGIDRNDTTGEYHLIYSIDGARYDMALKDKETISGDKELIVYDE